jgi:Holliday junction resolvasome RuvABC endonuclease subunit
MKRKNKGRILAIDPGTRNIGYAVVEGGCLMYFGVKTIPRSSDSNDILKEGRSIITDLLKDFRPQVLVVERTYFGNNSGSETLNEFYRVIAYLGRRKGLQVASLPVNTVRKQICGNGWANKEKVVKSLIGSFPQLKPYARSDREWKKDFHQNMFDAVALGLASEIAES